MAPQKEFESPTFRLGGGRSILLSYWGIHLLILPNFFTGVKKIRHIFYRSGHIMLRSHQKGANIVMRESSDPREDLDDLIFDQSDGGPSER